MLRRLRKIFYRGIKRDKFRIAQRQPGIFLLNYKNYIDRKIMVDGNYEAEQFAMFSRLTNEMGAEYFFDIGANIGLYTVQMARVPGIHSIFSFEPVPANRNQLHANVLLNGLNSIVHISPFALSNASGSALFLQNKGNSTGRSRLKETNTYSLDDEKFEEVTIQTERLDALSELTGRAIAIKIDVEGHELMVLQGMPKILQENICLLQIECYAESRTITEAFLKSMGYSLIAAIDDDRYYSNRSVSFQDEASSK